MSVKLQCANTWLSYARGRSPRSVALYPKKPPLSNLGVPLTIPELFWRLSTTTIPTWNKGLKQITWFVFLPLNLKTGNLGKPQIDQNWPYLKTPSPISTRTWVGFFSPFCMTGELWTPQTVWHQDIMITPYHPGIMSLIFTRHNLCASIHHYLLMSLSIYEPHRFILAWEWKQIGRWLSLMCRVGITPSTV